MWGCSTAVCHLKKNGKLWKNIQNMGPFLKCLSVWRGCSQVVIHLVLSPATNMYLSQNHVSSSSSSFSSSSLTSAVSVLAVLAVFPPAPLQVVTHINEGMKDSDFLQLCRTSSLSCQTAEVCRLHHCVCALTTKKKSKQTYRTFFSRTCKTCK